MNLKFLLIGIIVLGIMALIITFLPFFTNKDPSSTDKGFFEKLLDDESAENNQQNIPEDNEDMIGGGESSNSGSAGLSPGCIQQAQISYSIQNLRSVSACLQNSSGVCENKTVTCSLDIYNLDDTTSGEFILRLFVIEQGENTENSLINITSQTTVESNNNATITEQFDFQSLGEDGQANKNLVCNYRTEFVPKKCV